MVTEELHHVAHYDWLFVAVSVALSVAGSFAALVSALRIPLSVGRRRLGWTGCAALSLGGGAIWAMHFIGMVAYQIDGVDITYNALLTALSLIIAVGVSALGLALVGADPRNLPRLALGGLTAGLGVAAMHYTGMAAMITGSSVSYDTTLVAASVVIAVVAATAALWIAFRVRRKTHVAIASLVMGAAVCGMHYTAMAATRVALADDLTLHDEGTDPVTLSLAVFVLTFSILAIVIFSALGGVAESDIFTVARRSHRSRAAGEPAPGGTPQAAPPAVGAAAASGHPGIFGPGMGSSGPPDRPFGRGAGAGMGAAVMGRRARGWTGRDGEPGRGEPGLAPADHPVHSRSGSTPAAAGQPTGRSHSRRSKGAPDADRAGRRAGRTVQR